MTARGETATQAIIVDAGPVARIGAYALGYQRRDLKEFLQTVQLYNIEQVLDIRENASSRKPGFAAVELKEALATIGVAYVHLPDLGCRNESRHALWRGEATESFFEDYRRRLAERPNALADLVRRVRSARSLLLCMERDPTRCHRAVLVEKLRTKGIFTRDL
jgi:uncharacterized protein (DUF488 family)